jgi:hypothetical protein
MRFFSRPLASPTRPSKTCWSTLLGKPIAESSALRIPTGVQPFPGGPPCYWMRQSGLADTLPSLRRETVYVGTSGGAMVATPDFGGETDDSEPLTGSE